MTHKMLYQIPAINFPRLEAEIEKLNRRAKKLGLEPIVLTIEDSITKKIHDSETGRLLYDGVTKICSVQGVSPKLNGWTLVAILEPVGDTGELLVKEVPSQTCPPQYRSTDFHCDHCDTVRRRNAIFVLRNETGEHKQVGRSCLADFLGHKSPESMLGKAEFIIQFNKIFKDAESDFWGFASGAPVTSIHLFLTYVACATRKVGYVSRAKSDFGPTPTANLVFDVCTSDTRKREELIKTYKLEPSEEDSELATKAIEWASAISPDESHSTYMHDLGVCCRSSYVTWRTAGYVASVISAYQRHLSYELSKQQEQNQSQFVGEIGKRLVFDNLVITKLFSNTSGMYPKTLVKFQDSSGNILVWWASGCPDWLKIGKAVTVKGTVTKHNVYENVPQTELKRVTVVETNKVAACGSEDDKILATKQ